MVSRRLFPILEVSLEEKARLSEVNRTLDALFEKGYREEAQKLKANSIKRATFLYGLWLCNFRCPKYCYTKGTSDGVLTVDQTLKVIEQAKEMGAQVTYWPGEGELTLLRTFWDVMDYQSQNNLPAVLFTNGSIFHDDKISKRVLGESSDDLVSRLDRDYPKLHLYVKYWHSDPKTSAEMVGVDEMEYPYEKVNGKNVPLSLAKLLQKIGRERLGVEVMVSRENYNDVVENLLPTAKELGIYAYVEPVLFSGNATNKQKELALTPEQHHKLMDVFASGGSYCEKRQSTELIVKGSMLTPGIAIPPRVDDTIIDDLGNVVNVFDVFHNGYFRKMRKISDEQGGCLCRKYWDDVGNSQLVQISSSS